MVKISREVLIKMFAKEFGIYEWDDFGYSISDGLVNFTVNTGSRVINGQAEYNRIADELSLLSPQGKNKHLIASVKINDKIVVHESTLFATQKAYGSYLRELGYKLRFVATAEKFVSATEKYYARLDEQREVKAAVKEARIETEDKYQETKREAIPAEHLNDAAAFALMEKPETAKPVDWGYVKHSEKHGTFYMEYTNGRQYVQPVTIGDGSGSIGKLKVSKYLSSGTHSVHGVAGDVIVLTKSFGNFDKQRTHQVYTEVDGNTFLWDTTLSTTTVSQIANDVTLLLRYMQEGVLSLDINPYEYEIEHEDSAVVSGCLNTIARLSNFLNIDYKPVRTGRYRGKRTTVVEISDPLAQLIDRHIKYFI